MHDEIEQFTKQCYEKPSLSIVRLFADNVLVTYSPCLDSNQCSQRIMAPPSST